MTPEHEQAAALLGIIWRGISAAYKSRYRRSVWQQFEDHIRSAAYTSSLGKFISSLCSKLSAQLGRNREDRAQANMILQQADARSMLKMLREETKLLVLMVQKENQDRREKWEEGHQELVEKG